MKGKRIFVGYRAIEVKKAMFFFILVTLYTTLAPREARLIYFCPPGGKIRHNAPLSQDDRVTGSHDSEPFDRKTHEAKTSGHSPPRQRAV